MNQNQVTASDFIRWCGQAIDFFLGLFHSLFQMATRHRMMLGVLISIGCVTGYFMGKDATSAYQAGITCTYNDLHKKSYGEMLLELSKCIQAGQTKVLASALKLGEDTVASITGLKAVNVAGAPLHEDLNPEKLPFYISYTLTKPELSGSINHGLIKYLQECDYNAVRRKIRISAAEEKARFLEGQIAQLDSLKAGYIAYFNKGRSSASEPADIKAEELYKEAEALFGSKQDQDWTIKYDNSVEIIYEQLPVLVTQASNKIRFALMGAWVGIIITLLVAMYLEAGKKVA